MSSLPPELQLMRLANAYQLSRAVQVAARLRLGELLREQDRTVAELAELTETDAAVLARLLRFLVELNVLAEPAPGRFRATELSHRLHLVDNIAQGDEAWASWGALETSLRTGEPSFPRVHGRPFYDYASAHPRRNEAWIEWNRWVRRSAAPLLAAHLELRGDETVVDVGGGDGVFLEAILEQHPACCGVLVDLPPVVEAAAERLRQAGLEERCRLVGMDVFQGELPSGDVYLLSRVLLNWDDASATAFLRACARSMAPTSRLCLFEDLLPELGEPQRRTLAASDLHLFLLWGGGHRTLGELDGLLQAAELERVALQDLSGQGGGWVVEARQR